MTFFVNFDIYLVVMDNNILMEENVTKEISNTSDKLGTMSIPKLMFVMSAPAMLSMLVQALYNIVDSIFVAKLGEEALTALSLAFPMQMIVGAFAIGIGVGTNSLIARELGSGRKHNAGQVAQLGLLLALISAVLFAASGYGIAKAFISGFTNDAEIAQMGTTYLTVVMTIAIGQCVEITLNKILQAVGNMIVPMLSQLIGAITNIILDPLFIFGLIGFPALGVLGAAIATVVGQICACIFTVIMILVKKPEIDIFFKKGFRVTKDNLIGVLKVGIPSIILNAVNSLTSTFMNKILIAFSETAVAVYGVFFKLQSFVFMPIFGLNQGTMPIMGYNYGARNEKRFKKTFLYAIFVALAIMIMGTLVFLLLPEQLLSLFNASENMYAIGIKAFKYASLCFIPAAASIIFTAMFTAVGMGTRSMFQSILRQIALVLPLAFVLGKYVGLDATWFAFPIAEMTTVMIFIPILIVTIKKLFPKDKQKLELN